MENERIKCPHCFGFKCDFLISFYEKTKKIVICSSYKFGFEYNCHNCLSRCRTCQGKGYLDWIEDFFVKKTYEERSYNYKRYKFFEDKKYWEWFYDFSRFNGWKDPISKRTIYYFYKDIYE